MANKNWELISYNQSANLTNVSQKNIEKDISEILDNYEWNFTVVDYDGEPELILRIDDLENGMKKLKTTITNHIKENFQKP